MTPTVCSLDLSSGNVPSFFSSVMMLSATFRFRPHLGAVDNVVANLIIRNLILGVKHTQTHAGHIQAGQALVYLLFGKLALGDGLLKVNVKVAAVQSQPLLTASATDSTGPSVTMWPVWKSLMAQQSEVTWPSKCHLSRRISFSRVLLPQQARHSCGCTHP